MGVNHEIISCRWMNIPSRGRFVSSTDMQTEPTDSLWNTQSFFFSTSDCLLTEIFRDVFWTSASSVIPKCSGKDLLKNWAASENMNMSTDNAIFQVEVIASSLVTNPVLIQDPYFVWQLSLLPAITPLLLRAAGWGVDYVNAINELRGRGERWLYKIMTTCKWLYLPSTT